jgi:SAM-dependent methyltransferase
VNFDRVADVYDATRGLPDEVSERVAEGIADVIHATPETRFLELGVGTGRIAVPVAARGYSYTGVDISSEMMARLQEKANLPNLTVRTADVAALPFGDGSFDAVLAIHVLHLVPEWRRALAEARRVTVPQGYFLYGGNDARPEDPGQLIRSRWREFAAELGAEPRPRHGSLEELEAALTEQGCALAAYRLAHWRHDFPPIVLIELLHRRTFSASWGVPDAIMDGAHERLLAWARETYGDLEQPVRSESDFVLQTARWPD